MSKKQGLFDAAIKILRDSTIRLRAFNIEPNDINFAIRVLKDWPKWKPLIEAAGKVDKSMVLEAEFFWPHNVHIGREFGPCRKAIRALLEALPEKEGK